MSDVTDQYLLRARLRAVNQYESLRKALSNTIQRQGRMVEQVSFIAGARSLDEEDLRQNSTFFQVPEAIIEPIRYPLEPRHENIRRVHEYP